jgi:hypothetical protein
MARSYCQVQRIRLKTNRHLRPIFEHPVVPTFTGVARVQLTLSLTANCESREFRIFECAMLRHLPPFLLDQRVFPAVLRPLARIGRLLIFENEKRINEESAGRVDIYR